MNSYDPRMKEHIVLKTHNITWTTVIEMFLNRRKYADFLALIFLVFYQLRILNVKLRFKKLITISDKNFIPQRVNVEVNESKMCFQITSIRVI